MFVPAFPHAGSYTALYSERKRVYMHPCARACAYSHTLNPNTQNSHTRANLPNYTLRNKVTVEVLYFSSGMKCTVLFSSKVQFCSLTSLFSEQKRYKFIIYCWLGYRPSGQHLYLFLGTFHIFISECSIILQRVSHGTGWVTSRHSRAVTVAIRALNAV